MNMLVIPEEDDGIALQRFLNLHAYVADRRTEDLPLIMIQVRDDWFAVYTRNSMIHLTNLTVKTDEISEWEAYIPLSWKDDTIAEYDDYRSINLNDETFIAEFWEFIEDYAEQ